MDFDTVMPYAFALFLAAPFLVLFRQFVFNFIKLKDRELQFLTLQSQNSGQVQALERLTLFLERIKPANLVKKFDPALQAHEFLFLVEKTIQEEFEYNASQQLFVKEEVWEEVVHAKNSVLKLARNTWEQMQGTPNLEEYKTVLLMNYMNGEDYLAAGINLLRKQI